jgi:hypothetical protein
MVCGKRSVVIQQQKLQSSGKRYEGAWRGQDRNWLEQKSTPPRVSEGMRRGQLMLMTCEHQRRAWEGVAWSQREAARLVRRGILDHNSIQEPAGNVPLAELLSPGSGQRQGLRGS